MINIIKLMLKIRKKLKNLFKDGDPIQINETQQLDI